MKSCVVATLLAAAPIILAASQQPKSITAKVKAGSRGNPPTIAAARVPTH
jgi:hypothetical protein